MIKINLLDSVTDRSASGVAVIETRVANPRTQALLLLTVVGTLTLLAMGFDWVSARSAHAAAQSELTKQQELAKQMAEVSRQEADLEKKMKDVQARIATIKQLRASQRGPVAVLSSINERLPQLADFHLASIEQKGDALTLTGDSPNEAAVTQFGRSLEFSYGLFNNVNIETQRKQMEVAAPSSASQSPNEKSLPKPETVTFTIKCKYSLPGSDSSTSGTNNANGSGANNQSPANQVAQK